VKVRLIHWHGEEAQVHAAELRRAGFEVDASPFAPPQMRQLNKSVPAAIIIDLSRLPSQGRDAGLFLRQVKATRRIPLVFVDGDAGKVAPIRRILPDATYTVWPRIAAAIRHAVRRRVETPVVPGVFAGYAGVPLGRKLGIKPNSVVALVDAPARFEAQLRPLPGGTTAHRNHLGH